MIKFKLSPIQLISIFLAIACFYFSISDNLFVWFYPDEIVPVGTYNAYGFWGCVKYYYLNTTINRFTADLGICALAQNITLFSSPFKGLVISRLFFFALIPISINSLLKSMLQISSKFGFIIACVLCSVTLFIISAGAGTEDLAAYCFGLDLAIYAVATGTFFLLFALFEKSIHNNKYFFLFSVIYGLNLNSHEVFLVISGLLIPLFVWLQWSSCHKQFSIFGFITWLFHNKKVGVLCLIYLVSALATIYAPGTAIRQHTWPSTGTFMDGISYMLLAIEESAYLMTKNYILIICVIFLGVTLRFSGIGRYPKINSKLFLFLFCSPIIYLLLTGYLIGITPSLFIGGLRGKTFHLFDSFLFRGGDSFAKGGFAIRQNLFLYTTLILDMFLIGYFIAERIDVYWKNFSVKYTKHFKILALPLILVIFILHPEGLGSMNILTNLIKGDFNSVQLGRITSLLPFYSKYLEKIGTIMFPRDRKVYLNKALNNIKVDHFLEINRKKSMPIEMYTGLAIDSWTIPILNFYQVSLIEPCTSLLTKIPSNSTCDRTTGRERLVELLRHAKTLSPTIIDLNILQGVAVKKSGNDIQLTDDLINGEHFISTDIQLVKGLQYLILEAPPSEIESFVYLISDTTSILFPWQAPLPQAEFWSQFGDSTKLQPFFSQRERSSTSEKIKIVINSPIDQKIRLRIQHGYRGTTSYMGREEIVSHISKALIGQIVENSSVS